MNSENLPQQVALDLSSLIEENQARLNLVADYLKVVELQKQMQSNLMAMNNQNVQKIKSTINGVDLNGKLFVSAKSGNLFNLSVGVVSEACGIYSSNYGDGKILPYYDYVEILPKEKAKAFFNLYQYEINKQEKGFWNGENYLLIASLDLEMEAGEFNSLGIPMYIYAFYIVAL